MQLNITTKLVKENAMSKKSWKFHQLRICPECTGSLYMHAYTRDKMKRYLCVNNDCRIVTIDERDLDAYEKMKREFPQLA